MAQLSEVIQKYKSLAVAGLPSGLDEDVVTIQALMVGIDARARNDPDFFSFSNDVYPKDDELWFILDFLTCPIGRPMYRKWHTWINAFIPSTNPSAEKLHQWIIAHPQA